MIYQIDTYYNDEAAATRAAALLNSVVEDGVGFVAPGTKPGSWRLLVDTEQIREEGDEAARLGFCLSLIVARAAELEERLGPAEAED